MAEEKLRQEFRQNMDNEWRNDLIEVINRNKLMSKKTKNNKKDRTTLNYTEHFLILGSTITGWVSIYALLL